MNILKIVLVVAVLALGAMLLVAQDDAPTLDPDANACFDGGSMAGKCDTTWEWECGWYLIRYDNGLFSKAEMPERCLSLVPADVTPSPVEPEATEEPDPCEAAQARTTNLIVCRS